jgi:hypothetical protein
LASLSESSGTLPVLSDDVRRLREVVVKRREAFDSLLGERRTRKVGLEVFRDFAKERRASGLEASASVSR